MPAKPLVLVVDDEPGILRLLDMVLSCDGFRVLVAGNAAEAMSLVENRRPDVVILDVRMPDMSGIDLMRRMRERITTPVILLTGQTQDAQKIYGLEAGADDYIVKPFSPSELGARVRAVLRRSQSLPGKSSKIFVDHLEIDLDSRLVKKAGEVILLTRTEWRLLQQLALNAGRVMLNQELLTRVWGPEYRDDLQYLRVWISRLRAKLESIPSEPRIIETFPGIGYMLAVKDDGAREQSEDEALAILDCATAVQ
ncbi:MAG TPA: response regulator transcription factor [Dehalococcoidia bacterium]|nr:response regulator transcription factor [Dehalococcoidia bacterium]